MKVKYSIESPAIFQLRHSPIHVRKQIAEVPCETAAYIEVGISAFQIRRETIIRLGCVRNEILAVARVVDGMRPDKVDSASHAMPAVGPQAGLQRVIRRARRRFFPINVEQRRIGGAGHVEVRAVRPVKSGDRTVRQDRAVTLSGRSIVRSDLRLGGLINIAESEQLGAPRPHVSHFDHRFAKLLLQVQVEILGIGSANVSIRTEVVR